MIITTLQLLSMLGGLAFALGALSFLAWVVAAELWSFWKAWRKRRAHAKWRAEIAARPLPRFRGARPS
jgi:hypothetical protein